MIVVKLQGGLGNQMFQYALGRSLSIRKNVELKLDINFLTERMPRENFTYRDYELDIFSFNVDFIDKTELKTIYSRRSNLLNSILLLRRKNSWEIITEPEGKFIKNLEGIKSNIYLDGYWQSERYFKQTEEAIKKDFTFKNPPIGKSEELLKKIDLDNAVCMHFRRGDFVTNPVSFSYHGVCSLDYYYSAIKVLKEKVANLVFFIFSDDIKWVKENFRINEPHVFIESDSFTSNAEDLRLMSHCKHHIIANSSFSWWGAWLNKYPNKIVIAPANWFKKNKNDYLLPESWIKI